MNYWATLNDDNDNDENESDEEESNIIKSAPTMAMPKTNKWTQRMARRREQKTSLTPVQPPTS